MNSYRVYLILTFFSSMCFTLSFTVNLIYQTTVVGLNPLQMVLVGTALEVTTFLFEVPTGVVADVKSRRLSMLIGYVLIGMGFLVEGLFPLFWTVIAAQVLWGIGWTFTSGAEEAWIADELGELGEEHLVKLQAGHLLDGLAYESGCESLCKCRLCCFRLLWDVMVQLIKKRKIHSQIVGSDNIEEYRMYTQTFYALQLQFAERIAHIKREPIERVSFDYTNISRSIYLGDPPYGDKNAHWREFLDGLKDADHPDAWAYKFYIRQEKLRPRKKDTSSDFGCFRYRYPFRDEPIVRKIFKALSHLHRVCWVRNRSKLENLSSR